MFTIEDYIESLKNDKSALVQNLIEKGISATDIETFTTLVPKVLDIIQTNNQTKSISITENGTSSVTPDTGYTGLSEVNITTNVEADVSEYFNSSMTGPNYSQTTGLSKMIKKLPSNTILSGDISYGFSGAININVENLDFTNATIMNNCFSNISTMTITPDIQLPNITKAGGLFQGCSNLVTMRYYDFSHVTDMSGMLGSCTKLENFPLLNLSSISDKFALNSIFSSNVLTNESLNNILGSFATVTSAYTGTKTLRYLFGNSDKSQYYPVSTLETLSNYQAFIDAGWTIGW